MSTQPLGGPGSSVGIATELRAGWSGIAIAKRVEKCTEVDGGIFEHLLRTAAVY